MLPQQRDDTYLPSVARELVVLAWALGSRAIVVIALKSTPFCAKSALEQLAPSNIVLLSNQ
jgi:hypothetical protein